MHVDLRPRSFGELVGLTLSLSVAHLAKLFPIALVLAAPGLAATVIQRDLHPVQDAVTILLLNLAVIAVAFVVGPLASADTA